MNIADLAALPKQQQDVIFHYFASQHYLRAAKSRFRKGMAIGAAGIVVAALAMGGKMPATGTPADYAMNALCLVLVVGAVLGIILIAREDSAVQLAKKELQRAGITPTALHGLTDSEVAQLFGNVTFGKNS